MPEKRQTQRQVQAWLGSDVYRALKVYCAENDTKIQAFVEDAILNELTALGALKKTASGQYAKVVRHG